MFSIYCIAIGNPVIMMAGIPLTSLSVSDFYAYRMWGQTYNPTAR